MTKKNLWYEIEVDPKLEECEGILYSWRRSSAHLKGHRDIVISALERNGARIQEHEEGLAFYPGQDQYKNSTQSLLEELAVLNSAITKSELGLTSSYELRNATMISTINLLEERKLADAYNLVSFELPFTIKMLYTANSINSCLYTHEREDLAEISSFLATKTRELDAPGGIVMLR